MDISNIVENFVNNDLKDGKLFLNIELVNGKLKNSDLVDLTDLTFSDSSRTWHQVRGVENPGSELGFWNLGFGNLGS